MYAYSMATGPTPFPMAPVNEPDMVLLPEGLNAVKRVAKTVGVDLRGAYLNLDAGFDSTHNRTCIFNAGMIPKAPRRVGRTHRTSWPDISSRPCFPARRIATGRVTLHSYQFYIEGGLPHTQVLL